MIDPGAIGDLAFVIAAYAVILGAIGLYAATLARRLRGISHPPIDPRA